MNFNTCDVTFSQEFAGNNWVKILDSASKNWLGSGSQLPETAEYHQQLTIPKQSFTVYEQYLEQKSRS